MKHPPQYPEMVWRVAQALCNRRGGESSCVSDIEQAKAAIAAMREPTQKMREAMYFSDHRWKLAIDSALKD